MNGLYLDDLLGRKACIHFVCRSKGEGGVDASHVVDEILHEAEGETEEEQPSPIRPWRGAYRKAKIRLMPNTRRTRRTKIS